MLLKSKVVVKVKVHRDTGEIDKDFKYFLLDNMLNNSRSEFEEVVSQVDTLKQVIVQ